ncbi:MAG: signal peptidase I [Bacteroidales bacterium]
MLEFVILLPALFTFPAIFAWNLFVKAGIPGWKTIIPFYNLFVWLRLIEKPLWWYIILIIPFINIFVLMLMVIELLKCYKKHSLLDQALAVIFPFFYLPWLGFQEETFTAPKDQEKIKKGFVRDWVDTILFAAIAAMIIRTFLAEAYTIPTSSMESSLLVGDYLFVSKLAYGPKVPNTPLSFPFVHHTLPLSTEKKSYLDWIELPDYRFPGFGNVKKGDAVVFNYPAGDTVSTKFQSNISYYDLIEKYGRKKVLSNPATFGEIVYRPIDKRENYIKRCIGGPGDSLYLKDKIVYINGKKAPIPENSQALYWIKTNGTPISNYYFDQLNVSEYQEFLGKDNVMWAQLTRAAKDKIEKLPNVLEVQVNLRQAGTPNTDVFPNDINYSWSMDNFGPIYIPKKGATIKLSQKNIALYRRVIHAYEGNSLEEKDGKFFINGKETDSYTFKMNYYWMMGDNRDNSADSRVWGYVPENHIVGKAFFVWLSLDKNKTLFDGKIRWNKLFRVIR